MFWIFLIALMLIGFILFNRSQSQDSSPGFTLIFTYYGISCGSPPKMQKCYTNVWIQNKFITFSGEFYNEKIKILNKIPNAESYIYNCLDEKRCSMKIMYKKDADLLVIIQSGIVVMFSNDKSIVEYI